MKDIRIPGVAWVIAIIVLIGVIHSNAAWIELNWHIEPWMIDLAITLLISGLKTINIGTEQLNQALDVIDALLGRGVPVDTATIQTRGVYEPVATPIVKPEAIPARPNNAVRWLVG